MRSRLAEHIHDARQRLVGARTHVERLERKEGCVDADHLISSRSSSAHSCATEAGHTMLTVPPRRRTLMRIVPSAGLAGHRHRHKTRATLNGLRGSWSELKPIRTPGSMDCGR